MFFSMHIAEKCAKLHVSSEGCTVPLHGDEDERDINTMQ